MIQVMELPGSVRLAQRDDCAAIAGIYNSTRACYAGVGEASIYVRGRERGRGLGGALADALRDEAERAGFYKLVGKVFADNAASRRLIARHGFREVGIHVRHGRLDGRWHDVLLVELLLGEAAR